MSKDSTHTQAHKRIRQFADKGTGYRSFLYLAAQPLLFSTDLLYKLWLNFSTYAAEDDAPCRSYLVVSDLILSGICRPVGVNLFSLDDDIREQLHKELDTDNRKAVAKFVYEYAEHNKTRLSKNIYDVHRIWAMGQIEPKKMENEIKEKLGGRITAYEKANYLSLYFKSLPLDEKGRKKANITLEIAEGDYEKNVLDVRLPVNLMSKIKRRKKNIARLAYFKVIPNLNDTLTEPLALERSISTDLRQSVELLPSSNGKIVSLLVTIPIPYLEERRPPYTTYLDIIKEFGVQLTGKQLVLLIEIREQHPNQYEQASIDMLKSSLQNEDLHIITTPKETLRSFSPWAQDAFLVAENSETSTSGVIIHPSNYRRENRSNDGSIAKEVADRHPAGYISYTFPAPIEAGNILVADDFILVGQDEILRSGYSESRFIQLFSNFFGAKKKIITVRCEPEQFLPILEGKLERHQTHILNKGDVVIVKTSQQHSIYQWRGKAQPVFHIDLFMTLLGRNSRGEQIILVGEPVADFDDHFLDEKEQQIFNEQIKDATDRINECIKNLKDDLNQHNIPYQILRNPLPLTYYNYHLRTSWYWASYNDCLVEISGGEKNVWLPRYYNNKNFENPHWKELRRFDEKSKEIFQQNGFNTYMFNHDFHALAANNGSLLSMTKCLQRVNIQQHSKRKIFYTVELIKTDSIYEMRTPEGNVLITKTEEGVDRGCMIKVENGELRVEEGIIQHPVLSSRMLLEGIEGVGIEMIDGVYLANVIADIDYRQRIGLKDDSTFTYKLGDYWVSFHVERVEQDGIEVDYLIINSKPER